MIRFKDTYTINDITIYHNGQELQLSSAELKHHESLHITYWECKSTEVTSQQIFRVIDPQSQAIFNNNLQNIAAQAKKAKFPKNKKMWQLFYNVKNMFANVQYVHASTIHKLQGSTYDISYIDLFSLANNYYMSDDEKYRLLYVAITRASKYIKIFISSFSQEKISTTTNSINTAQKFDEIYDILKNINL